MSLAFIAVLLGKELSVLRDFQEKVCDNLQ